jgi:hypothetical protein
VPSSLVYLEAADQVGPVGLLARVEVFIEVFGLNAGCQQRVALLVEDLGAVGAGDTHVADKQACWSHHINGRL